MATDIEGLLVGEEEGAVLNSANDLVQHSTLIFCSMTWHTDFKGDDLILLSIAG
jgi:hypothetical protein